METGEYVPGSVYFYAPNKGAPVFFAAAFGASGLYHVYQCIHYQCWRLTGLYVFCAALFTVGFIFREMGAFDYKDLIKYIVSICLIYAGPPLLELANYHILGRVLYYVPYHSPIHPGRVLTTFAFVSFIIETLNGTGVSYIANQSLSASQRETGNSLLKAALVIQLAVLALFVLLAATFDRRCRRAGVRSARLTSALRTLYASAGLLGVRTVFRVAEYWSIAEHDFWDPDVDRASLSPAIRYEWFFYVFEAALMLVNHIMLNVRHPRRYLPKSTKTYLSAVDGKTEVTGPGYKDERPFLVTLVDPFDLAGLMKNGAKGGKEARFWEMEGDGNSGVRRAAEGDVEAR